MMNQSQGPVTGIPVRAVAGKPAVDEPIVGNSWSERFSSPHFKQSNDHIPQSDFSVLPQKIAERLEPLMDLMKKFRSNANNIAKGIQNHVSLGAGVSKTVKGKLKLGTRILQAGGIERVFKKSFTIVEGEKFVKAFQCHLSTTAGPIPGLLFISTEKIGFLSERSLILRSPKAKVTKIPYKVLIPLRRIKDVNQSENSNKPKHKYIQIETIDDFDFWLMGVVNYQRSFEKLQQTISELQMRFMQ
ncbi:putative GEM-like protein 8 [Platanthera guangdongensis]|uniref:GEM-like protein 8 n=1 Tax=Platanthera guangdongensis TaxID=2320717 RepID=A0ABR2LNU9_9ASPA